MTGLILLIGIGLWLLLGAYVVMRLFRWPLGPVGLRLTAAAAFLGLWVLGPFADEYFGQKTFKRLCDEMPDVQFFGPVSVGEGPFFDRDGRPKWADRKEFDATASEIVGRNTKGWYLRRWEEMFTKQQTTYRIANWPVPVLEQKTVFIYAPSGQVVLDDRWRGSPGGWLKRVTGWGSHGPYQCSKTVQWPHRPDWIKY